MMTADRLQMAPLAAHGQTRTPPTEEEAELLEYDRTRGLMGIRYEKGTIFGLTGIASALVVALFGWVAFKKFWFVWLGMPGWW